MTSNLKPLWSVCLARWHLLCVDVSWCYSSWLKGAAESTVGKLDHRISMFTGLNVKHPYGEYLQVVNYGIGGHYEPHFDHATVSWACKLIWWISWLKLCWQPNPRPFFPQSPSSPVYKLKTGNRIATFMIYVSFDVAIAWPLVTKMPPDSFSCYFQSPNEKHERQTVFWRNLSHKWNLNGLNLKVFLLKNSELKPTSFHCDNRKLHISDSKDLLSVWINTFLSWYLYFMFYFGLDEDDKTFWWTCTSDSCF